MTNTYLDCFDFLRSTSGLETASLIGNTGRFTTTQAQGSSSLTVPATGFGSITVGLGFFDQLTIFDGSQTEVVLVGSAGAAVGATSIPLVNPTQFAHAVGVPWCTDGIEGSLADQIVAASAWIERECYQPLLTTTWTSEPLYMPSMRAAIANDGALTFRPRHWPVQSVSAIRLAYTPTLGTTYDATQVFIDGNHRLCSVPNLIQFPASQSSNAIPPPPARSQSVQLQISYVSGYDYATIPEDLQEAAILVTADMVAKRHNPVGATDLADGGSHITVVLRGDLTGESILIKRALRTLAKYSVELY